MKFKGPNFIILIIIFLSEQNFLLNEVRFFFFFFSIQLNKLTYVLKNIWFSYAFVKVHALNIIY
jgi:hypothetical protein